MKVSTTFTRTRIIAMSLTLCAIAIFGIVGTWHAEADGQYTLMKQRVSPLLTQPKPPQTSCGEVNARGGEVAVVLKGQMAGKAEACFWQTYQHCQAKTLIFHLMGVDTGVNNTLWPIKQKGVCHIADLVSHYSVSVPQGNRSSFITCTKLQKTRQGLLLSKCGKNANLLVPFPTSTH
jgi:hypothetical protein